MASDWPTAQRFIAEGARVVVTGRNQEALDAAVSTLGDRATGIRGDVANLDDVDRLFVQVREQFGRVDVLFANAGIAPFVPFRAVTEEHFDRLFNINVRGLFFTVQKALPLLSDGASVILNASVVAQVGLPKHERLFRPRKQRFALWAARWQRNSRPAASASMLSVQASSRRLSWANSV